MMIRVIRSSRPALEALRRSQFDVAKIWNFSLEIRKRMAWVSTSSVGSLMKIVFSLGRACPTPGAEAYRGVKGCQLTLIFFAK